MTTKSWSKKVMQTSNALDLEKDVFKLKDPKRIAASLRRSAEASTRRKAKPYQSAVSMLTFYINRGGKNIDLEQKQILEEAKIELQKLFAEGGE